MRKLFKNKKANPLDWFYVMTGIFVAAVAIIAAMMISTEMDDTGVFADNTDAQNAIDQSQAAILTFDNTMIFIIVGLSLYVLISSALVFEHPVFFIAGFFLLCIAVVIAAIVSNTYWTFANDAAIIGTSASFPKINYLMNHLPHYIGFFGTAAMILGYTSWKRQ